MKPLIGVLAKKTNYNGKVSTTLYHDYLEALQASGAYPIIIPLINDENYLYHVLMKVDGLLIPGGIDPNPLHYGEDVTKECGLISDELDKYELTALKIAYENNKPILGICRGLQIINVFLKGSLYQDLKAYQTDQVIIHDQNEADIAPDNAVHLVKTEEGTLLRELYGQDIMVNSFHHQIINKLGENLRISGLASDGVIEAIESTNNHFILAVQWHPEKMYKTHPEQLKIFSAFINVCQYQNN